MIPEQDGRRTWEALVAAEKQVVKCRAEFNAAAASRLEILTAALSGTNWERSTALEFLCTFPGDVPELLDRLVGLATSHRWAPFARRAISSGSRSLLIPKLRTAIGARLASADGDEYRRLAELLAEMQAWDELQSLVRSALASRDADIREVGEDFVEQYDRILSP
jgi:hypothetical protein